VLRGQLKTRQELPVLRIRAARIEPFSARILCRASSRVLSTSFGWEGKGRYGSFR